MWLKVTADYVMRHIMFPSWEGKLMLLESEREFYYWNAITCSTIHDISVVLYWYQYMYEECEYMKSANVTDLNDQISDFETIPRWYCRKRRRDGFGPIGPVVAPLDP